MPERTFKLIELVGVSHKSFADAANNAVKKAGETLKGLAWFEVVEQRGSIENGRIGEYQVKVKIAFRIMTHEEMAGDGVKKRR